MGGLHTSGGGAGSAVAPSEVKLTPPPSSVLRMKLKATVIKCKDLDQTCRWLFPLLYLVFFIIMYGLLGSSVYPHNPKCSFMLGSAVTGETRRELLTLQQCESAYVVQYHGERRMTPVLTITYPFPSLVL